MTDIDHPDVDRPAPAAAAAAVPERAAAVWVAAGFVAAAAVAGTLIFLDRRPPAAPPPAAPPAPPATAEAPAAKGDPGFDLVRVTPEGAAVIAGTATPGARVVVRAGEVTVAEVKADENGNFVALFTAEPSAEPRALSLQSTAPDGATRTSRDVVMLLPSPNAAKPAATAAAMANAGDAAPGETPATGAAPEAPEAAPPAAVTAVGPGAVPAVVASAPPGTDAAGPMPRVAATVMLRDGEVRATPTDAAPERQVALGSISYDADGAVTLEGLGSPGATVRAYVDGSLAREGTVGEDGRWALPLDDVARGIYRLRVDALDADGRVASRIETPFQRDFPRMPPPRPGTVGLSAAPVEGLVTVQPGNNLWTLARAYLGSGVRYTQIFTANRELIRDPNLIYPGQILNLPEGVTPRLPVAETPPPPRP